MSMRMEQIKELTSFQPNHLVLLETPHNADLTKICDLALLDIERRKRV